MEDFYNTPDDAAARQIAERVLSRGAVLHDIEIGPRDVVGIEGAIDYRTRMRRAFPDLKVRIDASTCSGDTFSCRYTCSGTHSGVCVKTGCGTASNGTSQQRRGPHLFAWPANEGRRGAAHDIRFFNALSPL